MFLKAGNKIRTANCLLSEFTLYFLSQFSIPTHRPKKRS